MILKGLAVLLLGTFSTPAMPEVLTFDDLGPGAPGIPTVYHGLNWPANFQIEGNADYSSSFGNSYGAASGFAATNGSLLSGLSEVSVSSGTFDFTSAEFSSFAGVNSFQSYSAESLQIFAYRPGDTIGNPTFITTIDLDPTQYTPSTLNWAGIDDLFFGAGNGPASDPNTIFGVDGLSWLMTDMDVSVNSSANAPEPTTLFLLVTGLAGWAFLLRRKRGCSDRRT
jgi:hypothetical protein